ncbi:DUF362 domain-containing protein [Clostridium sp. WLY-B-L2]|jgi:uncharacterized protein (DUF362 family)|uniref:DUF362 domain-containing protein n=1 Tax=Clostridium aromativorans TaxID=2836848 RepID=A0ABS8N541_9CLOT|nr:DUF362 domain-containing protein [Clostridium aromativorans]MCC9294907.1 DUF362 domain-containing protein [Clostridium aromativorans]
MSTVSIVKTNGNAEKDIDAAVRKSVEMIGGLKDIIRPGNIVLINPNLVAPGKDRLSGAVTRYEVCKSIADITKELGAEPIIAESSAAGVDTEKVMEFGGYDKLRERGYKVVDLKRSTREKIKCENGKIVQVLESWELVAKADVIISVPVMKTHDQTEVTLGIKNLKGLIHDSQKKRFHQLGVMQGVVDINQCLKPKLTIIDGIVGQEGLGPIFGDPVKLGLIIASKDPVAADSVGSAIMGYDPNDIKITKFAYERGLGEMNLDKIDIKGESIESVKHRFKRASETELEGVPHFTKIEDAAACTGCKNTLISAIMDMKNDHIEHLLKGKTIVLGPVSEEKIPKDIKKEDLILLGKCTKHLERYGTHVMGCPPNNIWVVNAIAGDKAKVARRYATEEDAND